MRIKQLELIGFKSFPQRTVLDFPRGISGVVGPNGCGKSNIVDAIRWVLGEQSPKHLRGEAMESVIFSGNERLAPLGMAEVSLTFENDGSARPPTDIDLETSTLPAHFRDLAEIRITRRYFRSGESDYFINKTPCRLKDITELFLGTGIGSKAYAIIEQGRVEQLINSKPEDRRLFIEEAAGTTLYRARKLAAERKMERTRENLARVNDVLHEIDRQVQYLQRQAKKAEEYRRLQEELRTLELRLAGGQWRRLQAQLAEVEAGLERTHEEERQIRVALEACEGTQQEAAAAMNAAEQRQAELREALAVLDAERSSVRERTRMLGQESQERERRRGRLAAELEGAQGTRERLDGEVRQVEHDREEWAQYLLFDEGELNGRETALSEARAAVAAGQASLEAAKGALLERVTREVDLRNKLTALDRRREEMARQLGKLRAEEAALADRLSAIDREIEARRVDVAGLRQQLSAATGEKESRADRLRALAEARRRWEREATEIEGVVVQVRSRLESLEQIQRNYEGFNRGVRAIMREEQPAEGVLGVVADVIDIPQQYERAVAAVLGDRLQYVIVRGEQEGVGAVDTLRREASGRGSFIPLQPRVGDLAGAASINGTSRRMLDLVAVDTKYRTVAESLLGDVVLVPDLQSAIDLYLKNGVHVTFVTPEGDIVDPSGVITGGSDRPIEEEILARRREIEVLRAAVIESTDRFHAVRAELEQATHDVAETETALKALDEGVHDLTVRIVTAEKDIERLDLERPQCISRRDVARYEIETLTAEDQVAAEEFSTLRERAEELSLEHQLFEQRLTEQRLASDDAVHRAETLAAEVTAMKVRVAERRERQQAAVARMEALRRQQAELAARETAVTAELSETEREREQLVQAIAAAQEEEAEQGRRREGLVGEAETAGADVQRLTENWRAEEQRARDIYASLDATRAQRGQLEVTRSEIRLRTEHLAQTMQEKYAADVAGQEIDSADGPEPEDGPARVDALRTRLGRIGDVNVGAIDELREFEERSGFLRTQRDDLERSLGDLERTIQKLNRVSRARFAETFARANETFQKVFPRLFRGGEARLVLTDEQNLLESGVEIVVRPPGKRLDSMALLSGGEKALVAVSLIFSLFLINPTPFCILDEVDAPLDDANIGRFGQMIREMSDRLQFLLITHNKRTMETADVLYGITMQDPGVSKVISVNIGN